MKHTLFAAFAAVSTLVPVFPVVASAQAVDAESMASVQREDATARERFAPSFTTARKDMVRRGDAAAKSKASTRLRFSCSGSNPSAPPGSATCWFTTKGATFTSGGFDWFVWYEQAGKVKRPESEVAQWEVRTRMAKYPAGSGARQGSYAVATIAGEWGLSHWGAARVYPRYFALAQRYNGSSSNGSPDTNSLVAFFNPDVDRVLFFERIVSNRYGISSRNFHFQPDEYALYVTTDTYNTEPVSYRRSLSTGEILGTVSTLPGGLLGCMVRRSNPAGPWSDENGPYDYAYDQPCG